MNREIHLTVCAFISKSVKLEPTQFMSVPPTFQGAVVKSNTLAVRIAKDAAVAQLKPLLAEQAHVPWKTSPPLHVTVTVAINILL